MGSWKKTVFLDIDGVCNSEQYYTKTRRKSGDFDPEVIALLNQLKDIGAEVVISSSWGEDGIKPLQDVGLELPIIGVTEHFYADWFCRGNEIEKWIRDNFGGMGTRYGLDDDGFPYYRKHYGDNIQDYEYVIFDDDSDFLLGQKDNFIRTNRITGLTQADIDKARKILNRENETEIH
jgi:hypothetical protein